MDAVIVDSVLAIRKGLTGGQETATVTTGGDGLREKVEEVAVSSKSQTTGGNETGGWQW